MIEKAEVRAVLFGVLCLGITAIEHAANGAYIIRAVMHSLVLEIPRYPAPIHDDRVLLTICIQMCVERSDDVYTLLAVSFLLYLNLSLVIKDSSQLHGLHGPFVLELVDRGGAGPNVL